MWPLSLIRLPAGGGHRADRGDQDTNLRGGTDEEGEQRARAAQQRSDQEAAPPGPLVEELTVGSRSSGAGSTC
eukprot:641353-Prorocentrum_minimum.AAC.1